MENKHTKERTLLAVVVLTMTLAACGGTRPTNLWSTATGLAPCPSSPNCVSTMPTDDEHTTAAWILAVPADQAWPLARDAVLALPRTTLVTNTPNYIHAEATSMMLRFVDDLELVVSPDGEAILVRSASRVGYSDMGVNRERVDSLRVGLQKAGVLTPAPQKTAE